MEKNNSQTGRQQLPADEKFNFACHSKVKCFNRCCHNADMYLYPYDIIRLKNRLGISSDKFLKEQTISAFRDDSPYFPHVMLRMSDNEDKACRFLSEEGCKIYEDRPFSCRAYPLEPAVSRVEDQEIENIYFINRHEHCLGHNESRKWTAEEWIKDQEIETYIAMNAHWVEMDSLFRQSPWGKPGTASQPLKMAFMACYNADKFREFVLGSSFLKRFQIPDERREKIKSDDVELMLFGFKWVKFFLTGKGDFQKAAQD
ncbi:YkgJ family cysteine cluster protein [Desulfobacterales bacterium HSG16]|nr:YkgJ family cysteine cluster protein [Desulfobacterales bacterium HSG16]